MIKNKKKLIFKAVVFIMVIFLMNTEVFSVICANGAGGGYEDPGGGKSNFGSTKENSIIESYIEEGGGYFLNAFSNIISISNRVEMENINGIDYDELNKVVDNALDNIRNAKYTYSILIQTALYTPYDLAVISKLKLFDYQAFMTEYSLNKGLLLLIKNEVSLNKMPALPRIWEVNEEASNNLTFGQYITRVFYALQKNR